MVVAVSRSEQHDPCQEAPSDARLSKDMLIVALALLPYHNGVPTQGLGLPGRHSGRSRTTLCASRRGAPDSPACTTSMSVLCLLSYS